MRFGGNKPDDTVRDEKAPRSMEKRAFSRIQRILANLLLVLGLTLLVIYASARIRGLLLSQAAVQRFEEQKRPVSISAPAHSELEEKALPPDFLSWSEKRIKAYQSSLGQHVA